MAGCSAARVTDLLMVGVRMIVGDAREWPWLCAMHESIAYWLLHRSLCSRCAVCAHVPSTRVVLHCVLVTDLTDVRRGFTFVSCDVCWLLPRRCRATHPWCRDARRLCAPAASHVTHVRSQDSALETRHSTHHFARPRAMAMAHIAYCVKAYVDHNN